MQIRNTTERFGVVAKTLHWLTLVLLIGAFTLAVSMVNMPFSPRKLEFYSWHKWVGVTIFLVTLLRLGWRIVNPVPQPPDGTPLWQRRIAGLSHAALYTILLVMPITGWIMSSALNLPVVYLGLVHIPSPFGVDRALGETMKAVHLSLAVALLVLVSIHILAALYHHLALRDDVLRRMLPWPARLRNSAAANWNLRQ
ncbi:MAG: cytochrome b [Pseudorhodoplanes sp.]